MDPITRASRTFLAESKLFWRRSRVLRMEASHTHRTHVVKTLRLAESAPENRWPLFLYDAPFVDAPSYFRGLADSIRHDYECIREGAMEEGVTLAAFALAEATPVATLGPIELAAVHIERAAMLLREKLEGVLVVLIPPQVPVSPRWSESLVTLARVPRSERVRLAVFDTPGGPAAAIVGNEGVRFVLDDQELGAYLKQLGPRPSAGPSRPAPAKILEARVDAAREEEKDKRLPRATAARKLRALLIDATQHAAAGQYPKAATLYKEAIAWCGAAGAHRTRKDHAAAAQAYETAAAMASHGESPILQGEALRLSGICHLAAGSEEKAAAAWGNALQIGSALDPEMQQAGALADVTRALMELLEGRGSVLRAAQPRSGDDASTAAGRPGKGRPSWGARARTAHRPGYLSDE